MKLKGLMTVATFIMIVASFSSFKGDEPWKKKELMSPSDLVKLINDSASQNQPIIFNIGPAGTIKNAIEIGATQESDNLAALKTKLASTPADAEIIIYCGCCPFEKCPNIRPAFKLIKEMNFKNAYLLDIPKNLKVDWIDKGYPMEN